MPQRKIWIGCILVIWLTTSLMLGEESSSNAAQLADFADSTEVIQCMKRCVRYEGRSAVETCKWRCANVSLKTRKTSDCMGIYKQCLKLCGSAQNCKKDCKEGLMNCS